MTDTIVADDHPLMLEAVAGLLQANGFSVVARCHDGQAAREAIAAHRPALAVIDIHMPRATGLEVLRTVREEGWSTRILLLTAGLEPKPILEAIRLKVDGLVLKGAAGDALIRAAEAVMSGAQWIDRDAMDLVLPLLSEPEGPPRAQLTPREAEVVERVAQGRRNKEIARELGISEGTVKMHLHNLYEKLSVSSRTELAIMARERPLGRSGPAA